MLSDIMPRGNPTTPLPNWLEPHERLKYIWNHRKRSLHLTQEKAGDIMGIGQAMVSHYLNGAEDLNVKTILWFCKLLGCAPTDIDPAFEFADICPGHLSREATIVAAKWSTLKPDDQARVEGIIDSLSHRP